MRRGAITHADGVRLAEAADQARLLGIPFVFFVASSGADVLDGVAALHGWEGRSGHLEMQRPGSRDRGRHRPRRLGAPLLLGLADLVVMSSDAVAFVSGPQMVAEFTGRAVGLQELGGTATHAMASGLCSVESDDVDGVMAELLDYLPQNTDELPPLAAGERLGAAPDTGAAHGDPGPQGRRLRRARRDPIALRRRRDAGAVATMGGPARHLLRPVGRHAGRVRGQPAQDPGRHADIAASQKGACFVRLCDAFNLPIVSLVDTPGFLPGKDLEWRGMIRHGAELAFAYAQATVPRLCLITRKAFGGAYIVMDSRWIGNDVCLAWPGAEVAVMGSSGAVQILHRSLGHGERSERER